jgi:MFS family permease
VPVAKLAEGRRRVVLIAVAALLFVAACLLVAVAPPDTGAAYPQLVVASIAVGIGECFHTTALMPLVADLAPASLRGRYMAAMGFSWWIRLAIGPTVGTQLLRVAPSATFLAAAGVAAAAAAWALALESRLPPAVRLTPRPGGSAPPRRSARSEPAQAQAPARTRKEHG